MSSFIFQCPFCNQKIDCDDELEKQIVPCPSCNNEIVPTRNPFEGKLRVVSSSPADALQPEQQISAPSRQSQIVINNYAGNSASPSQALFGNTNSPKQRCIYILLGIFLGGLGIHNFYAGYKTEGMIQLSLGVIGIFTCPPGFVLNLAVGAWALANIICRSKDFQGRPML